MEATLKLLSVDLLEAWSQQVGADLRAAFEALQDAEISTATFDFYTSVSAIASSPNSPSWFTWFTLLRVYMRLIS